MTKRFYSNGKLLITGEYVVLDGAVALALPTKMGQDLIVEETAEANTIRWKSFDFDQSVWFETTLNTLEVVGHLNKSSENSIEDILKKILFEAHQLNPKLIPNNGYTIETHLTFPRFWGLGTSSTLINNIAQWFEINAFKLLKNSFGGSGYDIANAQNNVPITYQLSDGIPLIQQIEFKPNYSGNLYFLYLNQKQDSKTAILNYRKKQSDVHETRTKINAITEEIVTGVHLERFTDLVQEHENIMSELLETNTVKERYFSDFDGSVKSLGAWGGDFVLVVSASNPKKYFESKGFTTLLPYHEMIL